METTRHQLVQEVIGAMQEGAITQARRPGVAAFRIDGPIPPAGGVMEPSICFILQGTKRAHFDGRPHTYEEGNFLLSTLAVPVKGEVVSASAERPVIGISFTLDLRAAATLITEMGFPPPRGDEAEPRAISVHPIDEAMLRTLSRLFAATDDDLSWRILGEGLQRELLFHVLRDEDAGWQLRQRLRSEASLQQVARAVAYIEAHLSEPLDVEQISSRAGLSASRLHAKFRTLTSRSPMQYVKYLRLHRARELLLTGESVTDAALSVGYASPSQFSREFKRQYGHPPSGVPPLVVGSEAGTKHRPHVSKPGLPVV